MNAAMSVQVRAAFCSAAHTADVQHNPSIGYELTVTTICCNAAFHIRRLEIDWSFKAAD